MIDVCFVLMPYAAVEHPSIAIGILKGCLNRAGISSKAIYANLWFAEEIGLNRYIAANLTRTEDLLGEWTFSQAVFPFYQPNKEEYFDLIGINSKAKDFFGEIRAEATIFIDKVAQAVLDLQPKIVSCSSTFQQHCPSLALLRRIKTLNPEIITLIGGANCEGIMGVTTHREFPWVDFVASGEGDELFAPLCQLLLEYGVNVEPKKLPYGVIAPSDRHRTSDRLKTQPPRATIHNLNNVPTPDYDDYFEALDKSFLKPFITPGLLVETSRGCWWGQKSHCTFCGLNGNGIDYRTKSTSRVIDEFAELSERYKLRKFEVVDNIISLTHLETLIPTFAKLEKPLTLFYETKANLKRHQVQQLTEAGVHWIQPGIESLHDEVLRLMNKGTNGAINIQLLKWAREFGLRISWNMLVDFPFELDEWYVEMAQWLPLIIHLQPPSSVTKVRYDRFSPYHENPDKYEIKIAPFKTYSYIYPLSDEAINDLAYFFEKVSPLKKGESDEPLDFSRLGLKAVYDFCSEWTKQFWSSKVSFLCQSNLGDRVQIFDTRPCASERIFYLEGLAATVYLACDRALTKTELLKSLQTDCGLTVSWEEVSPILADLKQRKILLEISNRFLSLAVNGEIPSLATPSIFAGGFAYDHTKPEELFLYRSYLRA